jgi:DNA sulfur modification protein DndC
LVEACGEDRLHYELSRELLSITRQQRNAARRSGLFENIQTTFKKHFYEDEADALKRAQTIAEERNRRKQRQHSSQGLTLESSNSEPTFEAL